LRRSFCDRYVGVNQSAGESGRNGRTIEASERDCRLQAHFAVRGRNDVEGPGPSELLDRTKMK
jgi:hypothetical protein